MTDKDTLRGLRYIANSPPYPYGGFHPEAKRVAKAALRLIGRLRKQVKNDRP